MKLILTQDVQGLGSPGDVVEVKDGYGRNYLLPRKLATRWTRGGQSQVDAIQRARSSREHASLDEAQAARDQLQSLVVFLPKRAGESGRLFGAVTNADIAEAITEAGGPALDRRAITMPRTVKSLGVHPVTVRLHPEVLATLDVEVVDADADPEALRGERAAAEAAAKAEREAAERQAAEREAEREAAERAEAQAEADDDEAEDDSVLEASAQDPDAAAQPQG